jgi:hypothetical protein
LATVTAEARVSRTSCAIRVCIALVLVCVATQFLSAQTSPSSVWPMTGHDAQRAGRSNFTGPVTPPSGPSWTISTGAAVIGDLAISAEGVIYFTSDKLYAANPDGTPYVPGVAITPLSSPAIDDLNGFVYVIAASDSRNFDVLRYSKQLQNPVIVYHGPFSFVTPTSMTIGPDGTAYFSDGVSVIAAGPRSWSSQDRPCFGSPGFLAPTLGRDGSVYVMCNSGGGAGFGSGIYRYDENTGVQTAFTGYSRGGTELVIDAQNNIRAGFQAFGGATFGGSYDTWDANLNQLTPPNQDFTTSRSSLFSDGLSTVRIGFSFQSNGLTAEGAHPWGVLSGPQTLPNFSTVPTVDASNNVFVGTVAGLAALSGLDGHLIWFSPTPDIITTQPTISSDGTVLAGSTGGNIYAFSPKAAITTGTISVTTNTVNAIFVISNDGKPVFEGSGTSFNQQAAAGPYTITYGHIDGFIEPSPEIKDLVAGSTISFSGEYHPLLQVGLITIDSNMPNATFSISPIIPDLGTGPYPVAEFIPSGEYIITFNSIPGSVTPPSLNVTITPGSSSKVTGTYRLLNGPHLSVSPKELAFSAPQGSPLSTILVISSGKEQVAFNTHSETFTGNSWIAVTQLTASTPSAIAVSINTNLATGEYTGQITIKAPDAAVSSLTIPVKLTVKIPIEQLPHLQIICRPLDDDNDPYLLFSRIGRHCYFLANDPRPDRNKFTTFSAFPIGGILGIGAKLTPLVNADLDSKNEPFIPGGCGTDALESECVDIHLLNNQNFDAVISQLHDAVDVGPEGTYDKANNNSNLWVQRRIDKIELAANLPNDIITSSSDVCRLFPLLLQRLKEAKLPVNISGGIGFLEDLVLGFYGTDKCLF